MNQRQIYLVFIMIVAGAAARDSTRAHFIKSFIVNEQKPTYLIMSGLCWNKNEVINIIDEVSKAGGRTSTSLNFKMETREDHLLFLVDLNCPLSENIISEASTNKLFSLPYRWLVLIDAADRSGLTTLWNSSVLADSDLVLAERTGDQYELMELHKATPNGPMLTTLRGYYKGTLTDVRTHRELYRRRKDIMGHPITMSNVIQDSNTTQILLPNDDPSEPQYDTIAKLSWMNAKLSFEMLNATAKYIFSYRWGFKVKGQWSGMIADLHTGRADLGTNCAVFNSERHDVVTFTDTVADFRVGFVFRQPPLPYVSNVFSLPFSGNVWVATALCTIMSTLALYAATVWEIRGEMKQPTQLDGTIGDAMLLTMSALSQQGCDMEPQRASGRLTVWVVFTALMALYAAYSANIVVLLQAPSNSITNLHHLATSKITLAANDVDYNHFLFSLYKDPDRVTIYRKVDPEKGKSNFYDINEGVQRIRQGLFAFHSIVEPVYRQIENTFHEHEKCDLMEVDFMNGFAPLVPVKKDSPYLELLRVTFKQIHESGIKSALNRRMQVPKPRCTATMSSFSSVGLLDMKPVLFLMLYGIGASVVVVFIEVIVWHIITKRIKMENIKTNINLHDITSSVSTKNQLISFSK